MKTRAFIAINIPSEIKKIILEQFLFKLQKDLNRQPIHPALERGGVKWVNPDGLHFTLHFLGYLDDEQLIKIKDILKFWTGKYHEYNTKIEYRISDLSGFPNLNRPRVIFLNCQELDTKQLIQNLQKDLGQDLAKLGIEIDSRLWHPHLTLGRVKVPQILRFKSYPPFNLRFRVESIDLMKSELNRQGARYTVLERFRI